MIPLVVGALGTVSKVLIKELEELKIGGRPETIQTTTLLRSTRILGRVLETLEDLGKTHTPVKDHSLLTLVEKLLVITIVDLELINEEKKKENLSCCGSISADQ